MRKLVALLITFSLIIPFGLTANALSTEVTHSSIDLSVEVIPYGSEKSATELNTAGGLSDSLDIEKVTYSYTIKPNPHDLNKANVFLSFSVKANSNIYHASATGMVNAYPLSSSDTLWEGPIDGSIVFDENEYSIIASFAKLESNTTPQITVTMQTESKVTLPFIFTFGDDIISKEIHQEISSHSENNIANTVFSNTNPALRSTETFDTVAIWPALYRVGDHVATGQSARIYFSDETNRLVVGIGTYCNNISDFWNDVSNINVETVVDSFSVRLIRDSNYSVTTYSWIEGIEAFRFPQSNFNAGAVFLENLFYDILSLFGVPTSTISRLLSSLKGSVTTDITTSDSSVSINFGLTQSANFDESNVGIPIVFQLDRNAEGYMGRSAYTFVTSIRYRSYVWLSNWNWPRYVYTEPSNSSREIEVDLG